MIILTVLTILGVIFQGVSMFRSGWLYNYGVGYFGPLARDGVWHEALVGQLSKGVPPQNPGFAGQLLYNYHYLYDLLVSLIHNLGISTNFLVYRFFPVVFSILLGIGTYKLVNLLFKDKKVALLAVFFAYFASSFGWVVNLIKGQQIGGESAFWANQPVSMNLNPPYAISLVIIIFSVILLDLYLKKPDFLKGLILSIAFGVLVGFKAYAGAICLSALFVLTLKKIFFDKNFSLLPVFIFSAGIFGFWGLRKNYFKEDLHIFIFSLMAISIIPTLIFVQKGNPWNVIQFFYYFLFFSGLYAANALKKSSISLVVLVLLITPISSAATFRSWLYPQPPAYLPVSEYTALKYLSTQTDGIVLKHPFDRDLRGKFKDPYPLSVYADNSYVSAYSGKSVYIEDVEQQIILNTDYESRIKNADRFFDEKDLKWSSKFLKDNNIRYIYLPKIYQLPMAEEEYPMIKIFENDTVNIYKVQ